MIAIAGTALIAVTGCGGRGENPTPGVQAESSVLVWADGNAMRTTKIDLQAATEAEVGKDYKQVSTTEQWSMGDQSFAAFGLDLKGRLVGSMVHSQGIDPATNLLDSGARIGTVIDGKFEAWPITSEDPAPAELRQVPYGSTDGENFIWYETPDTSIVATQWKIFAKRKDEAAPVLLAESGAEAREQAWSAGMGDIEPVIHGDRVFWHAAAQSETGGEPSARVISTDLNGKGELRFSQRGAANPVSLDDAVAAIRIENVEGTSTGDDGGDGETEAILQTATGIVLLNDDGTSSDLLGIAGKAIDDIGFGTMRGSGNSLSFSFNGETFIVDTKTKDVVSFAEPAGGYLAGLAHCGDTVTWTYVDSNGEGIGQQYVYSTNTKTLRVVNEPELFGSSLCQGEYLSWSVRDSSNDGAFATEVVTKWSR